MWMRTVPPSSVLAALASALFLLNSGVAMRRALGRRDAWAAAFVAVATVLVAALLATVRAHERAERRRRGLFKAATWAQSAALTAMFAHRVAAALAQAAAPAMACLVWAMAGTTIAGGFYCLFLHGWDYGTDVVDGGRDARRAYYVRRY